MLQKLREKPEHIKKGIALAITAVVFTAIVFVWLSSWDTRMRGKEIKGEALSPFAGFQELFQGAVSEVKDNLSSMPSHVGSLRNATVTPPNVATSSEPFDISGVVVIDPSMQGVATSTVR